MASNEGFYEPCWTYDEPDEEGSYDGEECVCGETSSRNCPEHQSGTQLPDEPCTSDCTECSDKRRCLMPPTPARHPDSARFHELLEGLGKLHDQKQKDYGRDDDPFANVRASEDFGVDPWIGALTRMNDKVRRLQQFATKGVLHNEGVIDSLEDIAVYALIALVLYEQQTDATEQTPMERVP